MSKINLIGVDDIQLKKCTDGAIELWFGNVLAERFTAETFNEFVKIMQDAQSIFGFAPTPKIPAGYFPGQSPLLPRSGGITIGPTSYFNQGGTCNNGNT